jgi:hypothetical protein
MFLVDFANHLCGLDAFIPSGQHVKLTMYPQFYCILHTKIECVPQGRQIEAIIGTFAVFFCRLP